MVIFATLWLADKRVKKMRLKWNDEAMRVYEAVVEEDGNRCLLANHYSTKEEAVKAVEFCKANYKGNGELDCYVRYFDNYNDTIQDFNL